MNNLIWVEESPQTMAVGESIAWIFEFKDVGAADPTVAGVTLAYDQAGVDVSGTVLAGAAVLATSQITAKKFTPASAQRYILIQPATVDGNTVWLACKFECFDPKYGV